MNKITLLALSISSTLLASYGNAANQVADARGNAMGNTGVASADYLVAPFYNPALGSNFKKNDHFAFLLPALGFSFRDTDDTLTTIDDLQTSIGNFKNATIPSLDQIVELNTYLDQLEGDKPLTISVGLGFAIALPTKAISINLFARGYTEIIAVTDIAENTGDTAFLVEQRFEASNVDMSAFGYAEMGLSFAKEFTIAKQKISFGVSPKYQKMTTYAQRVTISDFDIGDYDESQITENAFNFDLGAVWYIDKFRTGLAIKDVLAQEIEARHNGLINTYKLNTQVTLAIAYAAEYFTAALDADLIKQTRFKNIDDDTQFVRAGIEGNAFGWAQLRAGYEIDMQDTIKNSITAGIGFSPFDLISLDIAASYAGANQLGFSTNLAVTF